MADAMFAPVVTRFLTYDVKLDADCAAYCKTIMAMPQMQEWLDGAHERARGAGRARRGVLSRLPYSSFAPERLHHVRPFGELDADGLGELLRRAAGGLVADLAEALDEGRRRRPRG